MPQMNDGRDNDKYLVAQTLPKRTIVCVIQENVQASPVMLFGIQKNDKLDTQFEEEMSSRCHGNAGSVDSQLEKNKCFASTGCHRCIINLCAGDIADDTNSFTVVKDCGICFRLHYRHGCYLLNVLQQSGTFCCRFNHFCSMQIAKIANETCSQLANHYDPGVSDNLLVCILLQCEPSWVDYKWNYRLASLISKRIQLDDSMNWLNTLGGGYSALGDTFTNFAERAGEISFVQLQIAEELCEPPAVIRCRLYFSLSLMQRGRLRQAKHIIRQQYQLAKKFAQTDHRLISVCTGLWTKLQYYYKNRQNTIHRK